MADPLRVWDIISALAHLDKIVRHDTEIALEQRHLLMRQVGDSNPFLSYHGENRLSRTSLWVT